MNSIYENEVKSTLEWMQSPRFEGILRLFTADQIVEALPPGWKYPAVCAVRLSLRENCCQTSNFRATPWFLVAPVRLIPGDNGDGQRLVCQRMKLG